MGSMLKLALAAILPVAAAAILYLLDKKTVFGKTNYWVKQIFFGIVFGAIAVIGTEYGIPMNGAQVNCRDAAVLTGGLMFGAPAGIIAGVIGGVERWFAVNWGVGTFTQVACSVSTLIAGVYAALLRKFMFEDRKPGWFISLAIGIVMEVFHLTMVFITNMSESEKAMAVVQACTFPMVIANGVSVMLAALALTLLSPDRGNQRNSTVRISQTIQRYLLGAIFCAFLITSYFVYTLQNAMATTQADSLLTLSLDGVSADIADTADENILATARRVSRVVGTGNLKQVAANYDIAQINLVDKNGIVTASTKKGNVGFNMADNERSAAFLPLLKDEREIVQAYGPTAFDETVSLKYAAIATRTGFVQIGYDAAQLQEDVDSTIMTIANNRHVGQTGYMLVLNGERQIISAPKGFNASEFNKQLKTMRFPEENVMFTTPLGGTTVYCRYTKAEGYNLLSVLPEEEALQMRDIALYVNSFMEVLVFAILFALIYQLIKRVVVNQIKRVNLSLGQITCGNLDEVVDVRSNEEFASLSDDINSTVDTLKRYIAEASARIDAELEFAKNIQVSALPSVFPAFPKRADFDIFASMNPAKEVGGDFYDFYMTDSDTFHFLIADVSGKGIPAAMFMMRAKTELKTLTEAKTPLNEVFTNGNAALCEGNDAGMFVTAWQGSVDLKNGILEYANAGHNPPLIRHADGKFEYLRSRAGFVLAGMDGVRYKTQQFQLAPDDTVFLYTDGVTEATNAANELYGEDRLLAAANAKEFANVKEMCRYIKADVDAFVAEAPQFDDITMVAFKFIGTPALSFEKAGINDVLAVSELIERELEKRECSMKAITQINVAIDEIFSNIINHGYNGEGGPVEVKLVFRDEPRRVYVRFADSGIPYNPLTKEDPDITLSAEERSLGGLGIYLVKKTMDDVRYKYENGQNVLTIVKKF